MPCAGCLRIRQALAAAWQRMQVQRVEDRTVAQQWDEIDARRRHQRDLRVRAMKGGSDQRS